MAEIDANQEALWFLSDFSTAFIRLFMIPPPPRLPPHHRRAFMSSAPDAEQQQQESSSPLDPTAAPATQPKTSGGGDLTPPPGSSEQAEAEIMGPSTSTVFVAGGSGFVGSEICSQVKVDV